MHAREVDDKAVDGGPTVLTMRSIFEGLFADAAHAFRPNHATREPDHRAPRVDNGGQLDLYPDAEQSRQSIEAFAGRDDAQGFERFYEHSADP
ncbi:MAG: hypothetical protein CM15mP103_02780 [Gammaproteobacteria bacterium]|nr:MAG: hypothetical protein CM15mP103_02780 [Gammaproteobacteria bacterium]